MVREFYANLSQEMWSQSVIIRGLEVNFSPLTINQVLDTLEEIQAGAFNELCLHPPYQAIRYIISGCNSMAKWVRHTERGYHLSFPFAYMSKEARVMVKIVTLFLSRAVLHKYNKR